MNDDAINAINDGNANITSLGHDHVGWSGGGDLIVLVRQLVVLNRGHVLGTKGNQHALP